MNISLSDATAIVDRAISRADAMGVPMNIAVVDGGGHLIAFARMDKAILGSIDIALAKAKTSILFNGPSENLWEYCKPGGPAPATEHTNSGLIPYAGGVVLNNEDGELIGAIGVSGGLPEQDGEVASAGAGVQVANDAANFEREADIKANFARIMKAQLDPQDMIDRMVSVIGSDDGKYRNVWPRALRTSSSRFKRPTGPGHCRAERSSGETGSGRAT